MLVLCLFVRNGKCKPYIYIYMYGVYCISLTRWGVSLGAVYLIFDWLSDGQGIASERATIVASLCTVSWTGLPWTLGQYASPWIFAPSSIVISRPGQRKAVLVAKPLAHKHLNRYIIDINQALCIHSACQRAIGELGAMHMAVAVFRRVQAATRSFDKTVTEDHR